MTIDPNALLADIRTLVREIQGVCEGGGAVDALVNSVAIMDEFLSGGGAYPDDWERHVIRRGMLCGLIVTGKESLTLRPGESLEDALARDAKERESDAESAGSGWVQDTS